jgi:predicted transcriptional regulator
MFVPTKSYTPNLTVIRAPHKTNFTVVQNELWDDAGLSDRARAVAQVILRKPKGWKVIPKEIGKVLGRHVNTIYKYLSELVNYGLLIRSQVKNKFGQWSGYNYFLVEPTVMGGNQISNPVSEPVHSVSQKTVYRKPDYPKQCPLINTEINKYLEKELVIDLSPTSLKSEPDERDLWSSDFSDPEAIKTHLCPPIEAPEITSTALVSSEGESSAASYKKPTLATTKPNRKERRTAQQKGTWLQRGQENGLWESQEELDAFMVALHRHAANNPKLHSPGKWVESEIEMTCTNGTGTHWVEYQAELRIGTMDKKPWADVDRNVDPSFKSYVEQTMFGDSGNSPAKAVKLAAQVFANPAQCLSMWNEYQRFLERELEVKAKNDRLGVTYDAPGVLKPKAEISADRTAETQQVLRIDAAPQFDQPVIAAAEMTVLEGESDNVPDNIDWDEIATKFEAKMSSLGNDMSISKPQPQITPLSAVYGERKSIDLDEVKEYNVWRDLAQAKGLISYGYSESGCLVVVLADDVTVMPWKDARSLFGNLN